MHEKHPQRTGSPFALERWMLPGRKWQKAKWEQPSSSPQKVRQGKLDFV